MSPCLDESEACFIIRDIVRGLAHLQAVCRVMHRDIKLDNILVTRKKGIDPALTQRYSKFAMPIDCYEFKLGDLGLAKTVRRDT